ncbi:MAG: mechanosensitive ion channel family protein [Cyanobacteriota bacterium]
MPRRSRLRWSLPRRQLQRCLALLLPLVLLLGPVLVSAGTPGAAGLQGPPLMRQLPGPSPRQTLEHFLASTAVAQEQLQAVIHQGLAEPGWFFSSDQHRQAEAVQQRLEQATAALNLSEWPQALHPITGVGYMLMLRSLLQYDLAQHPGLVVPGPEEVARQKMRSWTIPETPITLSLNQPAPEARRPSLGLPCNQCAEDDFLFSPRTVTQVEPDFQRIFANDPALRHRYGGDLYVHWALLPGGILPPKWLLRLPPSLRTLLERPWSGQSCLQWLLLLVSSLPMLVAAIQLVRRCVRHFGASAGLSHIHWRRALLLLPVLLLIPLWRWFCIDWVNLTGERALAILVLARVLETAVAVPFVYLLAEACGQSLAWRRQHAGDRDSTLVRRRGAGQLLAVARVIGLVAGVLVLIQAGHSLGLTSLTILALSSVPALAISLGTQQIIREIIEGFSLFLDGQLKVGDRCTMHFSKGPHLAGTVEAMGMRSIGLRLSDGSMVSIPNSQVASAVVSNHSLRSAEPLELRLPLPLLSSDVMAQLQARAQAVMADRAVLQAVEVHLNHQEGSWWLLVSGRWSPDLSRRELPSQLDGLYLALHDLIASFDRRAPMVAPV